MLQTILSIAGRPGLYKLVSRGKMNLIVEALDETHKRQPAFATDRVTSLADIAMFTDSEDIPLGDVLAKVRLLPRSCRTTLLRSCPTSIVTVYIPVTSRNSFNGMRFSSKPASPTSRKR